MVKNFFSLTETGPQDMILWAFLALGLFLVAGALYFIGPLLAVVITALIILTALILLLRIGLAFAFREVKKHVALRTEEDSNVTRIH